MATLLELVERGDLIKIDPALSGRQQEFRVIYASPRLVKWLSEVLPSLESTWTIELSPIEQLDALLSDYGSGEPLAYGRTFKHINHVSGGIWEFKTADLRLFGWFPLKDCFIGHAADQTDHIKLHKLYHGYAGEVARFRDKLDLDEPKFVPGEDPNDVVSAYTEP